MAQVEAAAKNTGASRSIVRMVAVFCNWSGPLYGPRYPIAVAISTRKWKTIPKASMQRNDADATSRIRSTSYVGKIPLALSGNGAIATIADRLARKRPKYLCMAVKYCGEAG